MKFQNTIGKVVLAVALGAEGGEQFANAGQAAVVRRELRNASQDIAQAVAGGTNLNDVPPELKKAMDDVILEATTRSNGQILSPEIIQIRNSGRGVRPVSLTVVAGAQDVVTKQPVYAVVAHKKIEFPRVDGVGVTPAPITPGIDQRAGVYVLKGQKPLDAAVESRLYEAVEASISRYTPPTGRVR